jgi:hypothetical protein
MAARKLISAPTSPSRGGEWRGRGLWRPPLPPEVAQLWDEPARPVLVVSPLSSMALSLRRGEDCDVRTRAEFCTRLYRCSYHGWSGFLRRGLFFTSTYMAGSCRLLPRPQHMYVSWAADLDLYVSWAADLNLYVPWARWSPTPCCYCFLFLTRACCSCATALFLSFADVSEGSRHSSRRTTHAGRPARCTYGEHL